MASWRISHSRIMASFLERSRERERVGVLALALTAIISSQLSGQAGQPSETILSLPSLLESVRRTHPLIGAAHARVDAARGARITAGTFGNPMVGYQVENARLPGRDAPPMDREIMTTATIPLEPLYQRSARVRRGDALLQASTADALAEQRGVLLSATHAFYRTALAQIQLATAMDLAAWLDSLVIYNRARAEEGVAAEADVIRSELERDRVSAEASMHEASLARARAELASFLTDRVDSRQLNVHVEDGVYPPPRFDAQSEQALAARPDVLAARDRTSAAQAGVTSERSMLLRQLGATIGTKRSAGFTSLVAGFSLPLPLLDQNRGEIARARAEQSAATFELAAVERVARADVEGATEAAKVLAARATALTRGPSAFLVRADEARRIALGAYREGAVPLIQVLDAARAWGEARVTYYQLLYAQHESVLELLVAQGQDPVLPPAADRGAETR